MKNLRKQKSSRRRKQRKAHFAANNGERRIRMSAHLSSALREKYGFRSFPVRVGDTVVVRGGKFDKREGTVSKVKYSDYKVYIDNCVVVNNKGESIQAPVHPSNLIITKFFLKDGRDKQLERKKKAREESMKIIKERMEEITTN